ncbi:MAG: multiheme c-type cytochrome, partial [Bacteroidales bacterium]|nr:multiheme c-type cytochrome [Bacteroidales bacterium]
MKIQKLLAVAVLVLFAAALLPAQDYNYIGAVKCKMCHNSEKAGFAYNIWKESLHAKALESLGSAKSLEYAKKNGIADPTKDPKCLDCHSTYHMVPKDNIETLLPTE